jgi:hypothetical protein
MHPKTQFRGDPFIGQAREDAANVVGKTFGGKHWD